MTRLIIVRHAESAYNIQKRIQGHYDSALTPKGRRQAKRLAKRLKDFHLDKIYSSDLGRAFSTAQAILKHKRIPIQRDPKLREIHLGDWEGMTAEEVDSLYNNGYQRWLKKPSICHIPKCEKLFDFRKRVLGRVREIARQNEGKTVLLVTHGGAITALLSEWLKSDFDTLILNLEIENTSITVADFSAKKVRLRAVSDTTHLGKRERNDHYLFRKHS